MALAAVFAVAVLVVSALAEAQSAPVAHTTPPEDSSLPVARALLPRVLAARRFLARRGWVQGRRRTPRDRPTPSHGRNRRCRRAWQPLGPAAVLTPSYGLVTGRISALALDPSDATGNRLYLGTTGGGVWLAQNAATANPSSIAFTPLTDTSAALGGVHGRLHQHRRAHRAARRHGRDPGWHRRPQRRARLLLRRGDSALRRRRHHLEPDPRPPPTQQVELRRGGLCRVCLEHRQSATGGGRRFAGLRGHAGECRPSATQLRRALLLAGQRRHLEPGHHHRRRRAATCRGRTTPSRAGRQRGHRGGMEPGAAVVYGGGALSRLLPVGRRRDLDAHDRRSPAQG